MKTAENKQKVFEELSLYDPFMFAKVLNDPEKCRGLFERVIGEPVKSVTGVQSRYDGTTEAVLAFQAESETDQYSVCVRHIKHGNVGAAGAHAMAMAENLCRGKKVQPQIVGIVITPFDPFGKMRGKYTLSYYDREADCGLSGGPRQIILSTVGRGEDKSLQHFLDYMAGRALVYHAQLFQGACPVALYGAAGHSHEAADFSVGHFQNTVQNQNTLFLFRQAGESLGHKLVVNQQIISMRRKNVAVAGVLIHSGELVQFLLGQGV